MTSQTFFYFLDKSEQTHKTCYFFKILNSGGHDEILDSITLNTNNR